MSTRWLHQPETNYIYAHSSSHGIQTVERWYVYDWRPAFRDFNDWCGWVENRHEEQLRAAGERSGRLWEAFNA